MGRVILLVAAFLSLCALIAPVRAEYIKEWESPDSLGFVTDASRFTFGNDRYDMDGDGTPELVLSLDRYQSPQVDPRYTYRVYSTSNYSLLWSYTPEFPSNRSQFFGFYDIDGDGVREAVFDDGGQQGGIRCVDWGTDVVELALDYGYINAIFDIDNDGNDELIVAVRDQITEVEHVEVWGGCTAGVETEGASPNRAAIPAVKVIPNPAGRSVSLAYEVAVSGPVLIEVVDVEGSIVRRVRAHHEERGTYSATWDGRNDAGGQVAPGVYYVRLNASGQVVTRKVVLVR
jgi:hypothetical protein